MPVYLVTDSVTAVRTMVEAARPAGALSALIDNRFDVSPALDATEALKHMSQGVPYITAPGEQPMVEADPSDFREVDEPAPEWPSLEAFANAADADEVEADDEPAPPPTVSGWSDEAEEVAEQLS